MKVTKPLDLPLLQREFAAAGVQPRGLVTIETLSGVPNERDLWTYDEVGGLIDLPPEAIPVVDAHVAPLAAVDVARSITVSARLRTTEAAAHEILRFPCEQKRLYQASLKINGVDAGNFVSKITEGRFTWKRNAAAAVMVGVTVVSNIQDTAASSWNPQAAVSGNDIVFTVTGAAGRTIDWLLTGDIAVFAPSGGV